jgi:hypothetical protein
MFDLRLKNGRRKSANSHLRIRRLSATSYLTSRWARISGGKRDWWRMGMRGNACVTDLFIGGFEGLGKNCFAVGIAQ